MVSLFVFTDIFSFSIQNTTVSQKTGIYGFAVPWTSDNIAQIVLTIERKTYPRKISPVCWGQTQTSPGFSAVTATIHSRLKSPVSGSHHKLSGNNQVIIFRLRNYLCRLRHHQSQKVETGSTDLYSRGKGAETAQHFLQTWQLHKTIQTKNLVGS